MLVVFRYWLSTFAIPAWFVKAVPPLPNSHISTLLPGPGPEGVAGWGPTGLSSVYLAFPASCLGQGLGSVPPYLDAPCAGCWAGHWQHGGKATVGPCFKLLMTKRSGSQRADTPGQQCRDCVEGCGDIGPGWSTLSGKTSQRTSAGLALQAKVTWQRD